MFLSLLEKALLDRAEVALDLGAMLFTDCEASFFRAAREDDFWLPYDLMRFPLKCGSSFFIQTFIGDCDGRTELLILKCSGVD